MFHNLALPTEIVNIIKSFLPPHPLQNEMNSWTRKSFFHKWYFNKYSVVQAKNKRLERLKRTDDNWYFKICLQDGFNSEQGVKNRYASKLDKKRMLLKLKFLGIEPWEVSTESCGFRRNVHGNFITVKHKGREIMY